MKVVAFENVEKTFAVTVIFNEKAVITLLYYSLYMILTMFSGNVKQQ